jgi:hypothetical protein
LRSTRSTRLTDSTKSGQSSAERLRMVPMMFAIDNWSIA